MSDDSEFYGDQIEGDFEDEYPYCDCDFCQDPWWDEDDEEDS